MIESLLDGIKQGDRTALSQAITYLESFRYQDQPNQLKLIKSLKKLAQKSWRIGITGAPGAGKSTLIDTLGLEFIKQGRKVAVLAIDPSSSLSGGSIMGDKVRMSRLAANEKAFIRPSPSSNLLGGIALSTREAIIAVEAAGYDCVIVETVGVGQSESLVRNVVDVCVLLTLTGSGDDIQAVKRGLMELADIIVVNKSDQTNIEAATELVSTIKSARGVFVPFIPGWEVSVMKCSALQETGIENLTSQISKCFSYLISSGYLQKNRIKQNLLWFDEWVGRILKVKFLADASKAASYVQTRSQVETGGMEVVEAIEQVLDDVD